MGGPGTSPFGARGMSSVRYGTRLGDLKNKQPTESLPADVQLAVRFFATNNKKLLKRLDI